MATQELFGGDDDHEQRVEVFRGLQSLILKKTDLTTDRFSRIFKVIKC